MNSSRANGSIRNATVQSSNHIEYGNIDPAALFAMAIVGIAIAIVGATVNAFCCLLFHKVQMLYELPMRPLVQTSFAAQVLQHIFVQMVHVSFMFVRESSPQSFTGLCQFGYFVHSFTMVTICWTFLFLTLMRFCHTHGFSFYFRYKRHIITASCVFAVLAGSIEGILGLSGVFEEIGFHQSFLLCFRLSSMSKRPLIALEVLLVGWPIAMTVLENLSSLAVRGNFPLQLAQAKVFSAFNVSFLVTLLLHAPLVILVITQSSWGPSVLYPISAMIASLAGFVNTACLLICYPSFRTICQLFLHGWSWSEIQMAMAVKRKKRFVAQRHVRQEVEQHRFVEEAL